MNNYFEPFPVLTTDRLLLRQLDEADMDEFFLLKSDERLLHYYFGKPRTYEEARRKLQALNEDIPKGESITWGIARKETGRLVGSVCFWNFSGDRSIAEIGYELMVEHQGKGIMQEAAAAVIAYGFNALGLVRMDAFPNSDNTKSVRLLEKLHFHRGELFSEPDPSGGTPMSFVTYVLHKP